MSYGYRLENMLRSMERLARYIYWIEQSLISSENPSYKKYVPVFKKNGIVNELTWFQAQEQLLEFIENVNDNRLSYQFRSDFLENELPNKLLIYEKHLLSIIKNIKTDEEDHIEFVLSNILFDLSRVLIRFFSVKVEFEIIELSVLENDRREIEIAKIIDEIASKLSYEGRYTDFVEKKYLIYRRERLNRIFNRSIDQSLKSISATFSLLDEIVRATKELQGKRLSIGKSEKARTLILSSFIQKYTAKDESGYGVSETGKTTGEIDIKLENSFGEVISICEAFNLKKSFDKTVINKHIKKVSGYNANGLEVVFVIIFSELQDFEKSWKRYYDYVETISIPEYHYLRKQELNAIAPAKMNICDYTYRLNGRNVDVYHLFVDMK